MPSFTKKDLDKIDLSRLKDPHFIETGTYQGRTIFGMEPHFQVLHTIEIKKEFYENVTKKYRGKKIKFYHGDTYKVLGKILKKTKQDVFCFLDGHWSGGNTGRGLEDVPLLKELNDIMAHPYRAVIVIDDFRLFGIDKEGWGNVTKQAVHNIVKSRVYKEYYVSSSHAEEDRYIIELK